MPMRLSPGGTAFTSTPSYRTSPESGGISPAMIFRSVVLPHPLGPRTTIGLAVRNPQIQLPNGKCRSSAAITRRRDHVRHGRTRDRPQPHSGLVFERLTDVDQINPRHDQARALISAFSSQKRMSISRYIVVA